MLGLFKMAAGRSLKWTADAGVKLAFYEWAYGYLAEPDADIGILGEYMVGLYVGGLAAKRREKAPCDLVAADGRTVEVKTSFGREPPLSGETEPNLRWQLRNERAALRGERPVSDIWIFVHVAFPEGVGWLFNVFDPRWWRVWVVPGEAVRALNQGTVLRAASLEQAGYAPHPLSDLPELVCPSDHPVAELARENTEQANALLRLAYFEWAYGDLTGGFNGGRLAEFQVLRVLGRRPFGRRKVRGPVDLVTRYGQAVEVKYSRAFTRMASGALRCDYLIPVHGGARQVDHFVFCQLAEPGIDPLPHANWRFRWVPATVLANYRRKVANTVLERLGYPLLTARQLNAAARRDAEERSSPSAHC